MKFNLVPKYSVLIFTLVSHLFAVVFSFCNVISNIYGPTAKLYKYLTLYFHGDTHLDLFHECYRPNFVSIPQMKFSRSYSHELTLHYTRFVGPSSVILVPLNCSSVISSSKELDWYLPEVKLTFWKLLLLPTTLLVLSRITSKVLSSCPYAEQNTNWDSQEIGLNFVIALQMETFSHSTYYEVNCKGYCSRTDLDLDDATSSILRLHKKYFYTANNKELESWISWIHDEIYEESKTKEFLCDIIYRSKKYEMLASARYCWGKQRTAIEISKVHNISYREFSTLMEDLPSEYFSQDVITLNDIKSKHFDGTHLQYFSGNYFLYCEDVYDELEQKIIDYQIWTLPISLNIGIMMGLCWLIILLLDMLLTKAKVAFKKVMEKIVFVYNLGTRCSISIPDNSWPLLIFVIGSMLFWIRYEMELGSVVTVRERPKAFETAKELFENGFKGAYEGNCSNSYDGYVCVGESGEADYYINHVKRRAYWSCQGRWLNWYLPKDRTTYKGINKAIECFNVKEEQQIIPYFSVAYTVNRHWILQTLGRIDQGGFVEKWDKMGLWAEANQDRETFIEPQAENLPDLIDFWRIVAVVILWGSLMNGIFLVFLVEIGCGWWTQRNNRVFEFTFLA